MHICSSGRQQSELICHTSLRNGKQCESKNWKRNICMGIREKSLDQESRPVVIHLGPDLPFESFRLSPHELLFYSGEDGDRNNFMSLRCIVYFGSPNTRDWQSGVSAADRQKWQMQEHVLAEGLRELGWFSLEKGRLWGEITAAPRQCPWGGCHTQGARLLTAVPAGQMRHSGQKLKEERFRPLEFSPWGRSGAGADDPKVVWLHPGHGGVKPNWACSKLSAIWSDPPALSRRLAYRHPKFPSNMIFLYDPMIYYIFPKLYI